MRTEREVSRAPGAGSGPRRPLVVRRLSAALISLLAVALAPTASAHEVTAAGGLTESHALAFTLVGVAVVAAAAGLKRTGYLSPTRALYVVFAGIVVAGLGAVLFEGLSPDLTYAAETMPIPRAWYRPLGLGVGLAIVVGSFVAGLLRWPTRPRYTFLGIALGAWVLYPYLLPGYVGVTHPLGYALVLGTPAIVGYVLWTDAGAAISATLRDPVARRFGVGVGAVLALFFTAVTGYLSFFLEPGVPHEANVAVLPTVYQLVAWPTLEIILPHVPFFLAVSPGQVAVAGTLSALVGLNAAFVARRWRLEEAAGLNEGTAGSAAIVGSCTCGCCGPLVAKVGLLFVGPSVAAPLYWLFVDSRSPLGTLFLIGSMLLFVATLVYSAESARDPAGPSSAVAAD